jgi:tetratricopeptide (TPR) repeat protein
MGRFMGALTLSLWLGLGIAAGAAGAGGCGGAAAGKQGTTPAPAAASAGAPGAPASVPALPEDTPGEKSLGEAELACSSSDPEARALYLEGHSAAERGDLTTSEAKYLAAIARDPDYCDAMDNLAVQYRRSGRTEEAIKLYERSVAVAPHNEMGWQNLGFAYQSLDRYDDALRAYQQIIDMSPRNPEGWFGYGQTLLMVGRFSDARPPLLRAEALYAAAGSSLRGDVLILLGVVAGGLKDWPTARTLLEAQYASAGRYAETNRILGEAYLQADALDLERARLYLERARTLGADVPDELWQRAHPKPAKPAKPKQ